MKHSTTFFITLLKNIKISLRYKLLVAFLCLGLFPLLLISSISYIQSYKSLMQNNKIYSDSVTKLVSDNFDRWLSEYEYTSLDLINSQEFQDGIENYDDDFIINQNYMLKFTSYAANRPEITDIAVYRSNDRIDSLNASLLITSLRTTLLKGSELVGKKLYNKVMQAPGRVIWVNSKVYKCNDETFDNNITMMRKIKGLASGKDLGILIIHIDSKYINTVYNDVNLSNKGYIMIVADNGKIISHSFPKKIGSVIEPSMIDMISGKQSGSFIQEAFGIKSIVTFATSKVTGWKVLSIVPMNSLMKNIYATVGITIVVAFIILIFIFILSFVISSVIFRPIKRLKDQMGQVEEGNLDIQVHNVSNDEIGVLTQSFQNMVNEVKMQILRQEEEQKKLRSAELLALQSQINPHFLYNTLDTALWYAKEIQSNEIQNILLSLARFYRISLSSGNNLISIANELEHVKSYMKIESLRFEGKFDVEYDIDDDILQYSIVKITLQPLVENAIKHGIRKRPGKGKVTIIGRLVNDTVIMKVADDGVGMTEEQLNELFDRSIEHIRISGSYGIKNVNDRLILQYGREYGLKYSSVKGEGTCVDVIIPIR